MFKNRNYFFLFTLIAVLVFGYLFLQNGVIIQRDFNFPIFKESFIRYHFPLWNDLTSQSNLEQLIRLVPRLPYILMAYFGLNVEIILKLMSVITYTCVSFFMFIFLKELFNRLKIKYSNFSFVPLILGSLFFAYSPTPLQFFWEISLILSLGVLPLLLFLILRYSEKNYKKFIILFALTLLLSVGHPFILIMNLIVSSVFSVLVLKSNIIREFRNFSLIAILFGALFLWFILPYISSGLKNSVDLGHSSNVEKSTFEIVSDNNLARILVTERDRFTYIKTSPDNALYKVIHNFSLYGVLFLSFLLFYLKKQNNIQQNKIIWFASIGFLVCTLLAFGQKSFVGGFYWWFIDSTPIGWIFRSPLKFQLYQVFFLSILFALSANSLLYKYKFVKLVNIRVNTFLCVIFSLIIIGSSIFGIIDTNINSMNPIKIPSPYYEITDLLKEKSDSYKVLWYPRYGEIKTSWSEGHMIGPFDMKSSINPTYNTNWNYNYIVENLYDIPYAANLFNRNDYYNYLSILGVGYVVFHNDRYYSIDNEALDSMKKNMSLIYEKDGWYLFKLNGITANLFTVNNCTIFSNQILIPGNINCPYIKNLHSDNEFQFIDTFDKEDLLMNKKIFSPLSKIDVVLPPDSIDKVIGWKFTQKIGSWLTILKNQQKDLWIDYTDFTTRKGVFYTSAPSILPKFNLSNDTKFLPAKDSEDISIGWETNLTKVQKLYMNEINGGFVVKLEAPSQGWKIIKSPLISMQYNEYSKFNFSIKTSNASSVHVKLFEYDANETHIGSEFGEISKFIENGASNWEKQSIYITPTNPDTAFIQIQIWYEDDMNVASSVKIEMKDFSLFNLNEYREPNMMQLPFVLDKDESYLFFIKYLENENGGNFDVYIDDNYLTTIQTKDYSNNFSWSQKIPFDLGKGEHLFGIKNNMGFNAIGEVLFTTESEFNSENEFYNQILDKFKVIDLNESNKATSKLLETLNDSETNIMEVKKISPTKYKLIIETNRPFLLSFTESFDPSWVATTDKNIYKSEQIYSTINGFWIEDTGLLNIVLEYKPQKYFSIGVLISGGTLLGCVGYLIYAEVKRRKLKIKNRE